jgi:hypothetical protein
MQTAYAERRDRTIFVYADHPADDGEVRFWLASRAMTFEALAEDPPPVIPPHLALTLSTRKPLGFCPWCGSRLSRFYRRRYAQLLDPDLSREFGAVAGRRS